MDKLNFIGPVNAVSYGLVAKNILKRAVASGVEVAAWPIGGVDVLQEEQGLVDQARAAARFFDPDAPCLRVWHPFDCGLRAGRGRYGVCTFFELDPLPPVETHNLNAADVIFVPSQWAKGVCERSGVTAEIRVASPGVDLDIFRPGVEPAELKGRTPDTCVFANIGKWEYRKNHDGVLAAFNAAFSPSDDVLLVMACHNPCLPDAHSDEWRSWYLDSPMGRAGKILIVRGRLPTQGHVASLMAAADYGVFPARAEGWNLEAAEMLAMGRRVVLTDYSAHTEYGEAAGATLIPVGEREPAFDGVFFDGSHGEWAVPDPDALVGALRDAYESRRAGPPPPNDAGIAAFRDRFTWDNCWAAIAAGLEAK